MKWASRIQGGPMRQQVCGKGWLIFGTMMFGMRKHWNRRSTCVLSFSKTAVYLRWTDERLRRWVFDMGKRLSFREHISGLHVSIFRYSQAPSQLSSPVTAFVSALLVRTYSSLLVALLDNVIRDDSHERTCVPAGPCDMHGAFASGSDCPVFTQQILGMEVSDGLPDWPWNKFKGSRSNYRLCILWAKGCYVLQDRFHSARGQHLLSHQASMRPS